MSRHETAAGDHPQVSRIELMELGTEAAGDTPWLKKNFDLVRNLRVSVSATLGTTEVSVAELFALKEGATVVLQQPIDATVDLIVENKVIARGEIVVAGDHFGIRILELLAPQ